MQLSIQTNDFRAQTVFDPRYLALLSATDALTELSAWLAFTSPGSTAAVITCDAAFAPTIEASGDYNGGDYSGVPVAIP